MDTGVLWRGTVDIVNGLLCSFAQTPVEYAVSDCIILINVTISYPDYFHCLGIVV